MHSSSILSKLILVIMSAAVPFWDRFVRGCGNITKKNIHQQTSIKTNFRKELMKIHKNAKLHFDRIPTSVLVIEIDIVRQRHIAGIIALPI